MAASSGVLPRRHSPPAVAVTAAVATLLLTAPALALMTNTGDGGTEAVAPTAPTTPPREVATTYTVRHGDSLWTIAHLHGVSTKDLAQANRLSDPFLLRPGDTVKIPAGRGGEPLPATVERAPAAERVEGAVDTWANAYQLPASLLKAVTWQESRWQPAAVSPRGAVGVGQVLPTTAEWISAKLIGARLDPWDIDDNVQLSAAYLRWLIDRSGGDQAAAIAAYHQGRTSTLTKGWYRSTQRYVRTVFDLRWRFESA